MAADGFRHVGDAAQAVPAATVRDIAGACQPVAAARLRKHLGHSGRQLPPDQQRWQCAVTSPASVSRRRRHGLTVMGADWVGCVLRALFQFLFHRIINRNRAVAVSADKGSFEQDHCELHRGPAGIAGHRSSPHAPDAGRGFGLQRHKPAAWPG